MEQRAPAGAGLRPGKIAPPAEFIENLTLLWFARVEFIDNEVEVFKGDFTLVR